MGIALFSVLLYLELFLSICQIRMIISSYIGRSFVSMMINASFSLYQGNRVF